MPLERSPMTARSLDRLITAPCRKAQRGGDGPVTRRSCSHWFVITAGISHDVTQLILVSKHSRDPKVDLASRPATPLVYGDRATTTAWPSGRTSTDSINATAARFPPKRPDTPCDQAFAGRKVTGGGTSPVPPPGTYRAPDPVSRGSGPRRRIRAREDLRRRRGCIANFPRPTLPPNIAMFPAKRSAQG